MLRARAALCSTLLIMLLATAVLTAASVSILSPNVCRTISLTDNHSIRCSVNEMVVNGGAECSNQNTSLKMNNPSDDLRGWQAMCSDGSKPSIIYAQCCMGAIDTVPIGNAFQTIVHVNSLWFLLTKLPYRETS